MHDILSTQSIWTVDSGVFVEKMCKIRNFSLKPSNCGYNCAPELFHAYKGHIYVMLSWSRAEIIFLLEMIENS